MIRHVRSTRGGKLIATVGRMLSELRMREYEAQAAAPVAATDAETGEDEGAN